MKAGHRSLRETVVEAGWRPAIWCAAAVLTVVAVTEPTTAVNVWLAAAAAAPPPVAVRVTVCATVLVTVKVATPEGLVLLGLPLTNAEPFESREMAIPDTGLEAASVKVAVIVAAVEPSATTGGAAVSVKALVPLPPPDPVPVKLRPSGASVETPPEVALIFTVSSMLLMSVTVVLAVPETPVVAMGVPSATKPKLPEAENVTELPSMGWPDESSTRAVTV